MHPDYSVSVCFAQSTSLTAPAISEQQLLHWKHRISASVEEWIYAAYKQPNLSRCWKHQKYISHSSYMSFAGQQGNQAPYQHIVIVNKNEKQELSTSYQVLPTWKWHVISVTKGNSQSKAHRKCNPITCPENWGSWNICCPMPVITTSLGQTSWVKQWEEQEGR